MMDSPRFCLTTDRPLDIRRNLWYHGVVWKTTTNKKKGNMSIQRNNPEYVPDEKKVWRGVTMEPYYPKPEDNLAPGIYFMAIEELQGAWIGEGKDKYWEEAEGGTEDWEEPTGEVIQGVKQYKTVTRDTLRARRYVLKRFESDGKVRNAHDGAYSGPRKYRD